MIIAVVLLGFWQLITVLAAVFLIKRAAARAAKQLQGQVTAELARLVAGEPCQIASVLNAIGRQVGSEAGKSAKASLMADLAHFKRDTALDASDAAAAGIGAKSPGLGAILSGMGPRTRKGLLSNPLAQLALQGLLGGLSGPGGNGQATGDTPPPPRRHRE